MRALGAISTLFPGSRRPSTLPFHTIGETWINRQVGQTLDPIINAPTHTLFGRDLIGNGIAGTASSPTGGIGLFLFGDGGPGYSQTGGTGAAGGSGGDALVDAVVGS